MAPEIHFPNHDTIGTKADVYAYEKFISFSYNIQDDFCQRFSIQL